MGGLNLIAATKPRPWFCLGSPDKTKTKRINYELHCNLNLKKTYVSAFFNFGS